MENRVMVSPNQSDPSHVGRVVADGAEMSRMITRIAHQILEANHGADGLVLLGIPTRGVPLANRLAEAIDAAEGGRVPVGILDITMYRDDLRTNPTRAVGRTAIPVSIDDAVVVLVDDVLFSGRTIAAALDALRDLGGRPRAVRLAVLVDRGHRELPISPDQAGVVVQTAPDEHVSVQIADVDGADAVVISREARP